MVEDVAKATKFGELQKNLLLRRGSARKGMVGDWRNHFTVQHVERFKAAGGDLLIDLGYETDMDWNLDERDEM